MLVDGPDNPLKLPVVFGESGSSDPPESPPNGISIDSAIFA